MRILYISTVFPCPEDNSTIYTDLAEELHKRGHQLIVVAVDHKRKINSTGLEEERGFSLVRVTVGNLYNVGLIEKGLTLFKIQSKLKKTISKHLNGRAFDLILFESPPITIAGVVKWAMDRFSCPSYLMLKDIFPQNGVDLGIISKGGIIHRYFRWQEEELYRTASVIGCMSEANRRYILHHNPGLNPANVEIFPNTKRIRYEGARPTMRSMRRQYGIPEDIVVAVFGGNLGRPQGVDFLMDVIIACKGRKDIFFLLVGRGTERAMMHNRIMREGLNNVLMVEPLPREDYERLIAECDIGLISLDRRFTIPNFPSRVLSYFEYRLPVLATTDDCTDFGKMVEEAGAGLWAPAGDLDKILSQLDRLVFDQGLRRSLGEAGRLFLEENYSVEVSALLLEKRFGVK